MIYDPRKRASARPHPKAVSWIGLGELWGRLFDGIVRRTRNSRLRSFTDQHNHFWLEQNPAKASKWARLARQGHEIAWEFERPGGPYTGRMLIDGEVYTPGEASKKFFKST